MTPHDDNLNECERYTEFAAMAIAEVLTDAEMADLQQHVRGCRRCRNIYWQYQVLATEGFATLARRYEHREASGDWDGTAVRRKLFALISDVEEGAATSVAEHLHSAARVRRPRRGVRRTVLAAGLAACLVLGAGLAAWRFRSSGETRAKLAEEDARSRVEEALGARNSADAFLAAQTKRIAQLLTENSVEHREAERLRARLRALQRQWDDERESAENGLDTLAAGKEAADEQVRILSLERERLSVQLRDTLQASHNVQTELASLRADRNKALLHQADLEARVIELKAANRDQERPSVPTSLRHFLAH
jgi:hypothetical protein